MKRKLGSIVAIGGALAIAVAGLVSAAPGGGGSAPATEAKKPEPYDENALFIETNATDGDAGLVLDLDGEDWNKLKITDPNGRTIMRTNVTGKLKNTGLTGMTFDSSAPPFKKVSFKNFKKRFPEGNYRFRGETIKGRKLRGSEKISHTIPDRPNVTSPTEGADVSAGGFKITWDPVTSPSGIKIVRYIAIVTVESKKVASIRELTMELPGTATSVTIPGEFLAAGVETNIEVIAKATNGNQTITEQSVKVK